ncbi:hypothetical protein [Flaviaesturariibacter flavus]|nr:hypothetical protein [Flaviaesturariibacter flavus]
MNGVLQGGTASVYDTRNDLRIAVVLHADPSWQRVGQLEKAVPAAQP